MLAGLQEVHLITEPEAAALAFGLGRRRTGKSQQALAAAEADESKVERTLVVRVSVGLPVIAPLPCVAMGQGSGVLS